MYSELTEQQQSDAAIVDTWRRGVLSSLLRVLKDANYMTMIPRAMEVDALIATLEDGEIIPNSTGLGGARDMDKDRFIALGVMLQELITVYETAIAADPSLAIDAVGVNA